MKPVDGMMKPLKAFVSGAALFGSLSALPANAADGPLTPHEQSLACKFSQACDPETLRSYSQETTSDEDGVIVGKEAPFNVFSSGKASPAPAAGRPDPAGVAGSGPRLYSGARVAGSPGPATSRSNGFRSGNAGAKRHGPPAPRKDVADMSVFFGNASVDLDNRSRGELKAWANVLNFPAFAGTAVRIEGHTNAVGGRDYNLELSQRRAEAVKQVLISNGVEARRIEAVGYGFDKPQTSNPVDKANRRVEIVKVK